MDDTGWRVLPLPLRARYQVPKVAGAGNPNASTALRVGENTALLIQPTSRSPLNNFCPLGGTATS